MCVNVYVRSLNLLNAAVCDWCLLKPIASLDFDVESEVGGARFGNELEGVRCEMWGVKREM